MLPLIPIRIRAKWPLPGAPTATAPLLATCDDGLDYVVKAADTDGLTHWPVRASELVCSLLCTAVGVPVPPCRVIEDLDGRLVFGSQIVGDLSSSHTAMMAPTPPGSQALGQISRIAALDPFVSNEDRHLNNYLVRHQNGQDRVFAMDFSHSLFKNWPSLALPLRPSCKTIARGRNLRGRWGFDVGEATECARRIEQLPASLGGELLSQTPDEWLDGTQRASFTRWWQSGVRVARGADIARGVADGTYL